MVLIRRFGLDKDAALGAIGELVHAIDLRDGRKDRPDDEARLTASAVLFDALYDGFQKGRRTQ